MGCPQGKSLNIEFTCTQQNSLTFQSLPNQIISKSDENECVYTLTMGSVYGCPTACPMMDSKICSGNGICDFDHLHYAAPRCFCYTAYQGFICEKEEAQSDVVAVEYEYDTTTQYVHVFDTNSVSVGFDLNDWFGDVLVINDLNSNDDVSYVIDSSSTSNQMSWQLYDDSNPAKGVQITFENVAADLCLFEINFICPNDRQIHYKPADGRIDSFVYKKEIDSQCVYYTDIVSAYACPKECVSQASILDVDGLSVCSNRGLCVADFSTSLVHCECDGKIVYENGLCRAEEGESKKVTKYYVTIAVIVVCVVIAIAVTICIYMRQKQQLSKLRRDAAAVMTGPVNDELLGNDDVTTDADL